MKVLFVLENYYPNIGGVEKLFKTLAESLPPKGYSVSVLTRKSEKDLPEHEVINGVNIYRIKTFNRLFFSLFSIPKALKLAKEADIIHTSSYSAALPARIAAKLSGTPSLITFHEVWDKLWYKLPFTSYLLKRAYRIYERSILKLKFSEFVAVSESTASALKKAGVKQSISTIYNGINYDDYRKEWKKPEEFSFCYLGRLGISKGLEMLVPAAINFIKLHPEVKFKLISPSHPISIYNYIVNEFDKAGLSNNLIHYESPRPEKLQEILFSSSCIVIPSQSEGFCFVAAEAVALGVPILSNLNTALKEVVGGKHILIEPLNTDGVINALNKAYESNFQEIMVKEYHLETSVDSYLKLYDRLILSS
ncbi:MAG: hypothetical protein CL663_01475 [Bacteroidetes bacterium]|nr:hypothetical protein [Bacteroidota bacterium]